MLETKSLSKSIVIFQLFLVCILLSACATLTSSDSPTLTEDNGSAADLHELKPASAEEDSESSTLDANEILTEAQNYFSRELYTLAKAKFELLSRTANSTNLRQFASIKAADCTLFSGDTNSAIEEYLGFIEAHPKSPLIAYAMFSAAQAYQQQAPGVGRDTTPLRKAKELYEKLIREYPNSNYSRAALEHFIETEDLLHAHRTHVTEFYAKQQMEDAYKARLNAALLAKQQKLSTAQELQELIKQAPQIDPPTEKALTKSFLAEEKLPSLISVTQMLCGPNQWDMIIYTSETLGESSIQIVTEGEQVLFKLPSNTELPEIPESCNQWRALSPDVLSRSGTRNAHTIYLNNPIRVILMSGADDEI